MTRLLIYVNRHFLIRPLWATRSIRRRVAIRDNLNNYSEALSLRIRVLIVKELVSLREATSWQTLLFSGRRGHYRWQVHDKDRHGYVR